MSSQISSSLNQEIEAIKHEQPSSEGIFNLGAHTVSSSARWAQQYTMKCIKTKKDIENIQSALKARLEDLKLYKSPENLEEDQTKLTIKMDIKKYKGWIHIAEKELIRDGNTLRSSEAFNLLSTSDQKTIVKAHQHFMSTQELLKDIFLHIKDLFKRASSTMHDNDKLLLQEFSVRIDTCKTTKEALIDLKSDISLIRERICLLKHQKAVSHFINTVEEHINDALILLNKKDKSTGG